MDEFTTLDKGDLRYWLGFSVCNGIGPVRFKKLLQYFGSAHSAWEASLQELRNSGLGEKTAEEVSTFRKRFSLEEYESRLEKAKVSYLTLPDDGYPNLLRESKQPPIVLYKKGTFDFNYEERVISVVGSRKITGYGKEVTQWLVKDLVSAGFVVVSGLAMGVDAVAHLATLDAGGKTVAVLGSGVDMCTPQENSSLYDRIIASGGAIVSEAPLGRLPNKGSFPARNRIIAGLSLGVLVTEGGEDSGSLITAHDAFSDHRKVFAVPGPITSSVSKGPLALISKGATIVTAAKDIITALGIENSPRRTPSKIITGSTHEEQQLIDLLQDQQLNFNEIVKHSTMDAATVGVLLSLMEVKGWIKNSEGFFSLTV